MAYFPYDTLVSVISLIDITIRAISTLLNELGFVCCEQASTSRFNLFNKATRKNEFSEKLKDENMIMETLTISRL